MNILEKNRFSELDVYEAIYTLLEREKYLREEYVKAEEDYQGDWDKNLDDDEFLVLSDEKNNRMDVILKEIKNCRSKREKLYRFATPVGICYFKEEYYYRADEYDYEFYNKDNAEKSETKYVYCPEINEMVRVRDILMEKEVPYILYQLQGEYFLGRFETCKDSRFLPRYYMRNRPLKFCNYCELTDDSVIDELLGLIDRAESEDAVNSEEDVED